MWYRTISVENEEINTGASTDAAVLARSAIEVETNFDDETFRPTELFVVTWDGVGYFDKQKDKVRNT